MCDGRVSKRASMSFLNKHVRIKGLRRKQSLNGCGGYATEYQAETDRYTVLLGGNTYAVKTINLHLSPTDQTEVVGMYWEDESRHTWDEETHVLKQHCANASTCSAVRVVRDAETKEGALKLCLDSYYICESCGVEYCCTKKSVRTKGRGIDPTVLCNLACSKSRSKLLEATSQGA